MKKYGNILDLIGSTPLVPVSRMNPHAGVEILAKLESFNPGGSIKDRPALYMIEEAEQRGELNKDKIILEATSGNTGIGLSLVAAVKGYRILLVMSESVSEERKKILRAMGAELEFTPAHLSTDGAIEFVYNLIRKEPEKYWLADQFNNEANWRAHYHGTAPEIWEQTGGKLAAVVATMGTTGTLMGLARRFKELDPNILVVGVEPYLGHKIQGLKNMKESYCPGIFERKRADRVIHVEDEEAYETARLLARNEGIFVGMSSGAAMAGALKLAGEMKEGRIVAILPDGGERYLSTSLFADKKRSGLFLFNTLTRKREEFTPQRENHVSMYTCGPTLCQLIHIGHVRRFLFADLVRRYLEFRGYTVRHVVNVTDLDDRTIRGAEKAGISLRDFTEKYYQEFLKDLDALRIKRATLFPRASEHVEEMIGLTRRLLDKGYGYEKLRSVYFDISRFKEYGRLSRVDLEKMQLGKTVDLEQYEKDNPRDFTLLKRSTLNELKRGIFYPTQWGNIRPSWHLECPAMAMKHLGDTYDIHTSGVELIFPHHENAIAISQAVTGKPPCNYWLHNELITMNGKKPSRSEDDPAITLRSILQAGYTGREIRFWVINHSYRRAIRFSFERIDASRKTLANLDNFTRKLRFCRSGSPSADVEQAVYDLRKGFADAMDDDLGVPKAMAALFEFSRRMNRIMDEKGLAPSDGKKVSELLSSINSVLEILDLEPTERDPKVETLVSKREAARRARDWAGADKIRKELLAMGVEIEDTPDGPVWKRV
ncbi:MAG: cysteine--tRNA ligase [Desulfobacteraceae bacterium]|nr:MAG: cysteine--tRNA ligase [Desulfobacteraceae bacterium]